MGSSSKRQTTMAKIARERALQEKRERKQQKKDARKQAAADERAGVTRDENGELVEGDVEGADAAAEDDAPS